MAQGGNSNNSGQSPASAGRTGGIRGGGRGVGTSGQPTAPVGKQRGAGKTGAGQGRVRRGGRSR